MAVQRASIKALAAADCDEPLWGQRGRFEIVIIDDKWRVPVRIETGSMLDGGSGFSFDAHAIEPGMFISETGYRGFFPLAPTAPKLGVSAWALAEINRWRNTGDDGKPRRKPRPFVEFRPAPPAEPEPLPFDDERAFDGAAIEHHILGLFSGGREDATASLLEITANSRAFPSPAVSDALMRLLARGALTAIGNGYRLPAAAEPEPADAE
jgi:hypothetical protein